MKNKGMQRNTTIRFVDARAFCILLRMHRLVVVIHQYDFYQGGIDWFLFLHWWW